MERKTFLTTAAGAVALGVVSAVPARAKLDEASDRNLKFMTTILNAVVEDLGQDASDYGGYKGKAIDNLRSALSNLNAALNYAETH